MCARIYSVTDCRTLLFATATFVVSQSIPRDIIYVWYLVLDIAILKMLEGRKNL